MTLGVGPAPARFEGYKYINNIVYTDWIIKSHQQLTELQILYRNNAVSGALRVMSAYSLITNEISLLIVRMEAEKCADYKP